jgi:hypothetical protein
MPDRGEHHTGRTIEFETPAGPVILAPAMIEVAARCGAEVVFTEVRLAGGQLVTTIAAPESSSAQAIVENFISFVRDCTAASDGFSRKGAKVERQRTGFLPVFAPLREKHRK